MINFPQKTWFNWVGMIAIVLGIIGWSWSIYLNQPKPNSITLAPPLKVSFQAKQQPTPTPVSVNILFAGDLMFDRHIRVAAKKSGNEFIFAPLKPILTAQDLVVANLEGPITDFASKSVGSAVGSPANYSFTFDPSLAATLKQHNIGLVSLGNNHILNFGQTGLDQTLTYLKTAQVDYFGQINPDSITTSEPPLTKILTIDGQKIGFVSYNQFSPGEPTKPVLAEIKTLRSKVDWLLVYAHWDREYEPIALPATTKLAHDMIEAGADLIIGSHPHVIQNHEVYQGKEIYYSLGNFIFDQYFEPAVKRGLLVEVELQIQPKKLITKPIYVKLQPGGQTVLE